MEGIKVHLVMQDDCLDERIQRMQETGTSRPAILQN
jgi:hypothetical protein